MTNPYRCFDVILSARERLSESFIRITLRGDDLNKCSPTLLDQRVKLVLGESHLLDPLLGQHWYTAWSNADERPVLRTYTLSAVRPHANEVDVDVVIHGEPGHGAGPASTLAQSAELGTRLLIVAADIDVDGHDEDGVAYHPAAATRVVLIADSTALPAVANILADRKAGVTYEAFIEVAHDSDIRELDADHLAWRVTDRGESVLDAAPLARALRIDEPDRAANGNPDTGETDRNAADDVLWDEAEGAPGGTYLWVAGEAAMVRAVRTSAKRAGIDRKSASFMGYWRAGRSSD